MYDSHLSGKTNLYETLFYCVLPRQPKRGLCVLHRFTNDGFDFFALALCIL